MTNIHDKDQYTMLMEALERMYPAAAYDAMDDTADMLKLKHQREVLQAARNWYKKTYNKR